MSTEGYSYYSPPESSEDEHETSESESEVEDEDKNYVEKHIPVQYCKFYVLPIPCNYEIFNVAFFIGFFVVYGIFAFLKYQLNLL